MMEPGISIRDALWTNGMKEITDAAGRIFYRIVDVNLGQIDLSDSVFLEVGSRIGQRLRDMDFDASPAAFVDELRQLVRLFPQVNLDELIECFTLLFNQSFVERKYHAWCVRKQDFLTGVYGEILFERVMSRLVDINWRD
jgi:hypothetical protein